MNVMKTEQLSAQSSAQRLVCRAMAAVAEIVVKSSRILLGLLTTGELDSYITTYNGSCPSNFNKISKASRAGQKCQAGWIQARELYVGHP